MREGYKKTEIGVIPVEWEVVNFKNFFSSVGAKKYQVQKSKYLKNGKYPIIDQGQKFIVGYSNEDNKVYQNTDGVIVFGDHTRIIKFIDFNFVIGADGTQLLKCIDGINQKFSYYVLSNKKLMNLGYSRHFKLVKEMKFPLPSLKEQQKIANILSTADKKIEAIDLQIQKAETLKKGLLQKLLSEGIGHSVELKDICSSIIGGGTPNTKIDSYWKNGTIPWATVKDMNNQKYLESTKDFITEDGLKNSSTNLIPKNSIITATRMGIGRFFINRVDMAINQDLKALIIKEEFDKNFIFWSLVSNSKQLELMGTGTTVKGIRLEEFKKINFFIPPLKEQKQIAQILSTADKKLEVLRAKKEKYETLKKGLLQKLLSGEVRVGCVSQRTVY